MHLDALDLEDITALHSRVRTAFLKHALLPESDSNEYPLLMDLSIRLSIIIDKNQTNEVTA